MVACVADVNVVRVDWSTNWSRTGCHSPSREVWHRCCWAKRMPESRGFLNPLALAVIGFGEVRIPPSAPRDPRYRKDVGQRSLAVQLPAEARVVLGAETGRLGADGLRGVRFARGCVGGGRVVGAARDDGEGQHRPQHPGDEPLPQIWHRLTLAHPLREPEQRIGPEQTVCQRLVSQRGSLANHRRVAL